jgi:hypothetical protein
VSSEKGSAIWILTGCLVLLGGLLCVGGGAAVFLYGGNPVADPLAGPTAAGIDLSPRQVVAIIDDATMGAPASRGAECRFTVEGRPEQQLGYWCNAQIVCGGQLLYGGPSAGFFPCTLSAPPNRHVSGSDAQTSSSDTDAAMTLDTATGTLTISDDQSGRFGAYQLRARVTSVQ